MKKQLLVWIASIIIVLSASILAEAREVDFGNTPPVARFSVDSRFVDIDQKVNYYDESYDPEGDEIVDWEWTNKQDYYTEAGEQRVTLRVKDKRGLWSKPFTINLMVRDPKVMDSFTLMMNKHPIGQKLDFTGEEPLSFPVITPERVRDGGATLILSDSPEKLDKTGILYADTASGNVRLFYYHENGVQRNKRVVVLAENINSTDVNLHITKQAAAGPSQQGVLLGQQGVLRYFKSNVNINIPLKAGEVKVINQLEKVNIPYKGIVHELIELNTSQPVKYTFLSLEPGLDPLFAYKCNLPILLRDNHPRGTFENADRYMEFDVPDKGKSRIRFGDNKTDLFLTGMDNLTGLPTLNHGNYGVVYTVAVKSANKLGAALVTKGGPYAGAVVGTDGLVHAIPDTGVLHPYQHGSKIGTFPVASSYYKKIKFMVPVACSTPIDVLMINLPEEEVIEIDNSLPIDFD